MSILATGDHHIGSVLSQPWGILAARAPSYLPAALFENHYALWIAAIVIGALCIMAARSKSNKVILYAGQAILVITLLWMLVARGNESPGERLRAAHDKMATAVEKQDADTIVSLMDPSFTASGIPERTLAYEGAKEALREILKTVAPKDVTITSYSHQFVPPDGAVSNVTVFAKTDLGPTPTSWQISWQDVSGADWKMISVKRAEGGIGAVP